MKCRLCQKEKNLERSHIIPDFFRDNSGVMYPTGKSGKPQPFTQPTHTHPGKKFQRKQHGYWEARHGMIEYLLCHDCEQKFGRLENYAKRFFYGTSNPIRLQLPVLENPLFVADYKRMKLFQLSILWRASEANGEFFSAVTLSDHHNERLRSMLANDDPGGEDEYFCGMNRLVVSSVIEEFQASLGISNETGFFAPISHEHGTWDSHLFVMGGIVWCFCVSAAGVPGILRDTYIKDNGRFWLMPMNADGFLINFCRKVVEAGNVTREDAEESIRAKLPVR
jgi:hypothetical protein